MNVNEIKEEIILLEDKHVLNILGYCDELLNKRLYWLRKGLNEYKRNQEK
jgi:hypothetical protein